MSASLETGPLRRLGTFWSTLHWVDPSALDEPGVKIGTFPAADFWAALLVRRGEACVVTVPDELLDRVSGIDSKTADDVFVESFIEEAFSDLGPTIIGPAAIAYLDRAPDPEPGFDTIAANHPAVPEMRAACDPTEWEHAGMTREPTEMIGLVEHGKLVAVANYETWDPQIAHVGVIVHPERRREGLGVRAMKAISRHAMDAGLVVQSRALETNLGSLGIGKRLGFEPWGRTMTVRIKA